MARDRLLRSLELILLTVLVGTVVVYWVAVWHMYITQRSRYEWRELPTWGLLPSFCGVWGTWMLVWFVCLHWLRNQSFLKAGSRWPVQLLLVTLLLELSIDVLNLGAARNEVIRQLGYTCLVNVLCIVLLLVGRAYWSSPEQPTRFFVFTLGILSLDFLYRSMLTIPFAF